jgi:hypothetical protein
VPQLSSPFPNPLSTSSRVTVRFDDAAVASVAIYDVAGRRVRQIIRDKSFAPGAHELDIERNELRSGVYFVRLETGRTTVATKLHVLSR